MKKKIFSLLAILLVLATLVACTPNTASYIEASNKVSSWKGSTLEGKFDYEIEVKDPQSEETLNMKFPVTFTGKQVGQAQAEIAVNVGFKSLKESVKGQIKDETELAEMNSLPDALDFKMYVDNDKIYMPKSIFEMSNPESVKDIKEDYLALSGGYAGMNPASIKYLNSEEFKADIMKLMDVALGDFKPSVDYKVEGNTYTFEANSDQIIDNLINGSDHVAKNWDKVSENLLAIVEKIEPSMTEEDKAEFKNLKNKYDSEAIKEMAKGAKEALKGSKIYEKSTFEDDKYTSNVKVDFNFSNFMKIKVTGTASGIKDENVKITLPTSAKEITMDEYIKLMMPGFEKIVTVRVNGEDITFNDPEAMPKIMNNRTMLSARSFYEKIGAKVDWNANAKTVTITKDDEKIVLTIGKDKALVNGKEVALDSPAVISNNKTYIPVRFVSEAFGYQVKYTDDEFMPIVDIFNITEKELSEKLAMAEKEQNYEIIAYMMKDGMTSEEIEKEIKENFEEEKQQAMLEAKKELENDKELLKKYYDKIDSTEEIAVPYEEETKEAEKAKDTKTEDLKAESEKNIEEAVKKTAETLFTVVR